MKKIYFLSLMMGAALTLTGCAGEEADLFSQSAAERLNEARDLYSARLTAQPNGWAMQLYPTTENEAPYGNGYLVVMRFNTDHSVYAAMNNELSNNNFIEDTSAWDIVTDNGPVLTFNSWNDVIHTFSSPEDVPQTGTSDETNDETGTGIGGDYEFIVVDAPEDASYMMLKGKKRSTYNLLTPVEEGVEYSSYLIDVKSFQSTMFPSGYPTYNLVHYGDSLYKMEGADDGLPNIYPFGQDAIISEAFNPFLITKRGDDYYLRFRDAKEYNGQSVQEFKYLTDKDIFESTDNEAYYICGDDPLRFFNECIEGALCRWTWDASSNSSESFKSLYSEINSSFKTINKNYSARSMRFAVSSGKLLLQLIYSRSSGKDISADFVFSYNKTDNGVALSYVEPLDTRAENVLSRMPGIQTLLDKLSGTYSVSAATTQFNLTSLKLTSAANTDFWFVAARG